MLEQIRQHRDCLPCATMRDCLTVCTLYALQDACQQLHAFQMASPDPILFSASVKQHSSLDFFDYVPYTACQVHPQLEEHCC